MCEAKRKAGLGPIPPAAAGRGGGGGSPGPGGPSGGGRGPTAARPGPRGARGGGGARRAPPACCRAVPRAAPAADPAPSLIRGGSGPRGAGRPPGVRFREADRLQEALVVSSLNEVAAWISAAEAAGRSALGKLPEGRDRFGAALVEHLR